jgi:hypothetical protein
VEPDMMYYYAVCHLLGKPYTMISRPVRYLLERWGDIDGFVRQEIVKNIAFKRDHYDLGGSMERALWEQLEQRQQELEATHGSL